MPRLVRQRTRLDNQAADLTDGLLTTPQPHAGALSLVNVVAPSMLRAGDELFTNDRLGLTVEPRALFAPDRGSPTPRGLRIGGVWVTARRRRRAGWVRQVRR